MIRSLSNPSVTLSDAIVPMAWVISVMLSILFAAAINAISFRKVGKTPLIRIAEY